MGHYSRTCNRNNKIVKKETCNLAKYGSSKKGILERLAAGPVIGDGGFVFELEKRGYVKAGPWTPEATVEHPEAVRQLHREFLRAGADVMQVMDSSRRFHNHGEGEGP